MAANESNGADSERWTRRNSGRNLSTRRILGGFSADSRRILGGFSADWDEGGAGVVWAAGREMAVNSVRVSLPH